MDGSKKQVGTTAMWNSWVGLIEQHQMKVWEIVLNVQEEEDDGEDSRIGRKTRLGLFKQVTEREILGHCCFYDFGKEGGGGDGIEFVEFVGVLYENIIHLPIFHHTFIFEFSTMKDRCIYFGH